MLTWKTAAEPRYTVSIPQRRYTKVEGDGCIAFLKTNQPKWIPSIVDREIKIERTHCIYSDKQSKSPRTVIFKLLDYTDKKAILKGAKAAYPVKLGSETLNFFLDYSADTTKKRKAFTEVRLKMDTLGFSCFSSSWPHSRSFMQGDKTFSIRHWRPSSIFCLHCLGTASL